MAVTDQEVDSLKAEVNDLRSQVTTAQQGAARDARARGNSVRKSQLESEKESLQDELAAITGKHSKSAKSGSGGGGGSGKSTVAPASDVPPDAVPEN